MNRPFPVAPVPLCPVPLCPVLLCPVLLRSPPMGELKVVRY